jgi:hypothetical protein
MKDYTSRTWNSLEQLKKVIEQDGSEVVVEFLGHTLTTKKWHYGLYDGILTRKPRHGGKIQTRNN